MRQHSVTSGGALRHLSIAKLALNPDKPHPSLKGGVFSFRAFGVDELLEHEKVKR